MVAAFQALQGWHEMRSEGGQAGHVEVPSGGSTRVHVAVPWTNEAESSQHWRPGARCTRFGDSTTGGRSCDKCCEDTDCKTALMIRWVKGISGRWDRRPTSRLNHRSGTKARQEKEVAFEKTTCI